MKKNIYLLLTLFTATPSMATQSVTNNLIVASTLVLSNTNSNHIFNKKFSLDLHKAIETKDYTSVKILITNPKVDVNAKVDYNTKYYRKSGYTPLIYCCWKGGEWLSIAKLLIDHHGTDVNLGSKYGDTPLITCCHIGDKSLAIAKLLLGRKDIKVNLMRISDGATPLIQCCWHGNKSLEIVRLLLERDDTDVNLESNYGDTPLITCCHIGDKSLAIAKLLLGRKDIKVNLMRISDGATPLMTCCYNGDKSLEIAKMLLNYDKTAISLKNKYGYTTLDAIIRRLVARFDSCPLNYKFVKIWNVLVANGAILGKYKADYENLNPKNYKEPQKGYVKSIISNPPKTHGPLRQENILPRKQVGVLRKKNLKRNVNKKSNKKPIDFLSNYRLRKLYFS